MITSKEKTLRHMAEKYGQEHLFQFWNALDESQRGELLDALEQVDFALMDRLIHEWVLNEPVSETFRHIAPIDLIPPTSASSCDADAAREAGEQALRDGKVGAFVVAGGQGTRLGFEGPKGSFPIGPITGKSLFQYHAEKIRNAQRRHDVAVPWYVMVSPANHQATRDFFQQHDYFGLNSRDVLFIVQRMVPCVDERGRYLLETPSRPAMSPNGHGGCIQALVEGGALEDAERRGVEVLSYFQVDNWAAKIVDPYFIGHHALRNAAMSSKCHRRHDPREAVGVHCLCDGVYRVIEYSELDLYPKLLETDDHGAPAFFAGNPAIHLLSTSFIRELYERLDRFPWHRAHKRIPYTASDGTLVKPEQPNGYKFETFIFDALRFAPHPPIALEIEPAGEYTPIKQWDGPNSVQSARQSMADFWANWLEALGAHIPRNAEGHCTAPIEISPCWALSRDEFMDKMAECEVALGDGIAIDENGQATRPSEEQCLI